MKLTLYQRRAVAVSSLGIKLHDTYYLPDLSYGLVLIYEELEPRYILDLLDPTNEELKEYIDRSHVSAEEVIKYLLNTIAEKKLMLKEQCWWKFKFGKEVKVLYELPPLPATYWKELCRIQ